MIKIPLNARTTNLAKVLDKVIADHKVLREQNNPGKVMGAPEKNPKLSQEDLVARKKKGDLVVATDVYAHYLENVDEKKIGTAAAGLFPNSVLRSVSGRFYYPPQGFMGWHTNSNFEGWRVYASWAEEAKKSYFRYYAKNTMHTEWEDKGWNFRAFQVHKSNLYWHCVYTDTNRYSFGFRFDA